MSALICGSLAFDTITTFPGRFASQILPEQVHILNVSFLVPTLRREFGGCAGNIAYTLHHLGGEPLVMAAVGADGAQYVERLGAWGVPTEHVRVLPDTYTAQAIIITDVDNNQITAFHPGAMQSAHLLRVPANAGIGIAIVAPPRRGALGPPPPPLAAAGRPVILGPRPGRPGLGGPPGVGPALRPRRTGATRCCSTPSNSLRRGSRSSSTPVRACRCSTVQSCSASSTRQPGLR